MGLYRCYFPSFPPKPHLLQVHKMRGMEGIFGMKPQVAPLPLLGPNPHVSGHSGAPPTSPPRSQLSAPPSSPSASHGAGREGSGRQGADVQSSEKAAELIPGLLVRLGQRLRSGRPRGPLLPAGCLRLSSNFRGPSSGTAAWLPLPCLRFLSSLLPT